MVVRNLDNTLIKAEAKAVKVINKPYVIDSEWRWQWSKDADTIIEKLGWKGLAMACATYRPDLAEEQEDGYPKAKEAYFFPHHKWENGELVLSYAGVRAAIRRLEQLKSRVRDGDVDTKANLSEAEKHLQSHWKFLQSLPELKDKGSASLGIIDEMVEAFATELINNAEEVNMDFIYKLELACEGFRRYFEGLLGANMSQAEKLEVRRNREVEDIKKFLAELKKEDAEALVKTAVAMFGLNLKEINVEETLKEELETVKRELEETKNALAEQTKQYETLKKEHDEYVAKVEAEKLEAQKRTKANERLNDLKENGVVFSEKRQEAVFAKLMEMTDEEYEEYKAELLEVRAGVVPQDDVMSQEGANATASNMKKRLASFNIEYAQHKSIFDEYAELAETM